MAVHERRKPPTGHGEVLCTPPFVEWAALAERNAATVERWPAALREMRTQVRAETVSAAERFTRDLGLPLPSARAGDRIVMTGHQPELYHPGVWVKDFLVQRFSEESGAVGLDVVVDTDACGRLALRVPRIGEHVTVDEVMLADGGGERAYVQVPVPDGDRRAAFRAAGLEALETLPAPALKRHFEAFCEALEQAAATSGDLGTLMTGARRHYEAPAETDYLELPLSVQARLPAFRMFAASLVTDARSVRRVVNEALGAFRMRTGTRSAAQPFPDLAETDGRVEVPFWVLAQGRRLAAAVDEAGVLFGGDEPVAALGSTAETAAVALSEHDVLLAPKALTLTLFERLFVADLFVHGTGGGRYDQVTDAVIAAYYGIEPPAYAVASMTLHLPLGFCSVGDDDVGAAEQRLHRFQHNPDSILPDVEFDTAEERAHADDLSARKAAAVAAIAVPDADRKMLGRAIRELNAEIASLLAPVGEELRASLDLMRAEREASAVLGDRTYPYCLWDPREVMDKVR